MARTPFGEVGKPSLIFSLTLLFTNTSPSSRALLVRDRAQLGVQSGWLRRLVQDSTGRNFFRDAAAFTSRERLEQLGPLQRRLEPVCERGRCMRVS